jgi:hypothetical protein
MSFAILTMKSQIRTNPSTPLVKDYQISKDANKTPKKTIYI